jgi:hypothetical protein
VKARTMTTAARMAIRSTSDRLLAMDHKANQSPGSGDVPELNVILAGVAASDCWRRLGRPSRSGAAGIKLTRVT